MDGIRLALSWLSVLPARVTTVDARTCRQAIALAPLVGGLLGAFAAAVLWVSSAAGAPALLAGLLTVAALVLVTRGMHVDGLADTVDGFGCYGPPERALVVMRDGSTGPFAVVALILVLGTQVVALAHAATTAHWLTAVLACAAGRVAFVFCCRRGIPAARPEGMGALVAGSQHVVVVLGWWVLLLIGAWLAGPGWAGVAGVVAAGAALWALSTHARRRFGGITGDVLGAGCEIATTIVLAACAFG